VGGPYRIGAVVDAEPAARVEPQRFPWSPRYVTPPCDPISHLQIAILWAFLHGALGAWTWLALRWLLA
jgi:hypothetical protein